MADHRQDQVFPGEPGGGWAVAPTLVDTEILTIALCRFTGVRPNAELSSSEQLTCDDRVRGLHPDVDCTTLYHQAEALRAGTISYEMASTEVTAPAGEAGDEPTYQHPLVP